MIFCPHNVHLDGTESPVSLHNNAMSNELLSRGSQVRVLPRLPKTTAFIGSRRSKPQARKLVEPLPIDNSVLLNSFFSETPVDTRSIVAEPVSLTHIFGTRYPSAWWFDIIAGLLEKQALRLSMTRLNEPSIGDVRRLRDGVRSHDRESLAHVGLKIAAANWLRAIGAQTVEFESRFRDVFSEDLETVVECGETDPSRIEWLHEDYVRRFAVVPFPHNATCLAYIFEGGAA